MHSLEQHRRRHYRPPTSVFVTTTSDDDEDMMQDEHDDVEQHVWRRQGGAIHAPSSIMRPPALPRQPASTSPQRNKYGRNKRALDSWQKPTSRKDESSFSCSPINFRKSIFRTLTVIGVLWVVSVGILATTFYYQDDFLSTNDRFRPFFPPKMPPLLRPPQTIPLPLPPNKITVVLINYSRPRMIRDSSLMRTLTSHPNVDQILLLHANPKTAFEFIHPKVTNLDATQPNDEMGLALRFYYCQLANNDWVLHVDDDMEFPSSTLNELLIEYNRNSKRIVGRFGRNLVSQNSFEGYNSHNAHKQTEVVLTKLMLMERSLCHSFFDYAPLIWDDVILNSGEGPLWNGEDIFMSLVANHVYGSSQNNYAMDWLNVWQAPDSLKDYFFGKLDISGGMSGLRFWDWHWYQSILRRNRHYSYRGKLWHVAKERLENENRKNEGEITT